jgi:hypothetical protein
MVIKSQENLIGAWAFFIGVIFAVVIGIFQSQLGTHVNWIYVLLAIIGFLIGILNVGDKDIDKFLIASVSLVIVSFMGSSTLKVASNIGLMIGIVLQALLVMFIPATIVVALKAVFAISKT